jgi:serine/threonine protein kinase
VRLNRGLFEDFYSIGKIIGIGTFAEVRLAESVVTNTMRAVKIINKKHLSRADDI